MSLRGRLDDVPLTDVMQFIHLGRRTGTLQLERGNERAEINFHRGAILGARSSTSKRLGELLLAAGLIDERQLAAAVREHESAEERRSFGQVLLATTPLSVDAVRSAVKQQIEHTVFELVAWTHGSFYFELDTLRPIDDISIYPGDLIPDLDLNTQMVLLEAARVFDERHRRDGTEEPEDETLPPREDVERGLSDLGDAGPHVEPNDDSPVLHLLSADEGFAAELAVSLGDLDVRLVPHGPVGTVGFLDGRSAMVVFDLRTGNGALDELARLVRQQPHATVIGVIDDPEDTARAYSAGAAAVVPWQVPDAIRGCVSRLSQLHRPLTRSSDAAGLARSGFAKLRRVVSDLRSGVFSATVALNLMNIIAESVERAVLFLVRQDDLQALGAFGFNSARKSLADITRGLHLPAAGEHALAQAIRAGHAISLPFEDAELPESFASLLGRPASGQIAVFPVMGTHRVILVIYADNGDLDRPIEEIEILDLVAAEVGIAFENELLRQQIARSGK